MKTYLKLLLGKGVRTSYGQFGEDAVIQATLKHIKKGRYVDVGAYDPVLYSNTYALYKKGWSGVVIDPNPSKERAFAHFRPRDEYVCAGVGELGHKDYYLFKDGAYNSFVRGEGAVASIKIPVFPLQDFMSPEVSFLNIDVEGMDLEVLQTYDWSHKPKLVAVEAKLGSECQTFLENLGYTLSGMAGCTLLFTYDTR